MTDLGLTFVQHPVVCVVVKNSPKRILLLYQIARTHVGVVRQVRIASYYVGLDCKSSSTDYPDL